jgi:hypothetical protein
MAQFHLLDPHYDEHHRGHLTAERDVFFAYILKFQISKCNIYLTNEITLIVSVARSTGPDPRQVLRRCGTMIGTLLSYRGLAWMSYRSRFAVGCRHSTQQR